MVVMREGNVTVYPETISFVTSDPSQKESWLIVSVCLSSLPRAMRTHLSSLMGGLQTSHQPWVLWSADCEIPGLDLQRYISSAHMAMLTGWLWIKPLMYSRKRDPVPSLVAGIGSDETSSIFNVNVRPVRKLRRISSMGPTTP